MYTLPYDSLLDAKIINPNHKDPFENMPDVVKMFRGTSPPTIDSVTGETCYSGQLNEIFDHLVNERKEYDGYHITGEMINQLIYAFPHLKEGWEKMDSKQKWLFIEGIYYGCDPLVKEYLGYVQK